MFNDPSYPNQQWHFDLIGGTLGVAGMERIWSEYTGQGVNVGVYDQPVDHEHEDLQANYDTSLRFPDDDEDRPGTGSHGTSVAGIIGAEADNGKGGVGVAHGVTMTGVNMMGFLSNTYREDALAWGAQNFDVTNHSYGSHSSRFWSDGESLSQSFRTDAYANLAETGRDGLGSITLQSAGNGHSEGGTLQFAQDANGRAQGASQHAVNVAATDFSGDIESYSNFGVAVLLSAPVTGMTTTNDDGYRVTFGGTSAATPVVSGVVSLMLEANPDLGWRDVHNILAMSSSQTGSTYGDPGEGDEQGDWFANGADNWNGGGASFHLSYGYGLVNAHAAVRMAEAWEHLPGAAKTSDNELSFSYDAGGLPVALDQGTTVEATIDVTQDMRIEWIGVDIDIDYSWAEDLQIWLVAPDGTEFQLFNQYDVHSSDLEIDWTFGVEAARGMSSEGEWTLRLVDAEPNLTSSGVLNDFALNFHGSAAAGGKVFHFTDDFLELAAADPGRTEIGADFIRGDWLNLAAVTGDVELRVHNNGSLTVDGTHWADFTTQFRNVILGDGDNWVRTSNGDSVVHGGRGNDFIAGGPLGDDQLFAGAGNDTLFGWGGDNLLEGGAGDDRLRGGSGNDTLIANEGDNMLLAGNGSGDSLVAGTGDDLLRGGAGNDTLVAHEGDNVLRVFTGDNELYGGAGDDRIYAGSGDDSLWAGTGDDILVAGDDGSHLFGNEGRDILVGGDGDDVLTAGGGMDIMRGGAGADEFHFARGGNLALVRDFDPDDGDMLVLNSDLWDGNLTAAEVVAEKGSLNAGGHAWLRFGQGDRIILTDYDDLANLSNHITIA